MYQSKPPKRVADVERPPKGRRTLCGIGRAIGRGELGGHGVGEGAERGECDGRTVVEGLVAAGATAAQRRGRPPRAAAKAEGLGRRVRLGARARACAARRRRAAARRARRARAARRAPRVQTLLMGSISARSRGSRSRQRARSPSVTSPRKIARRGERDGAAGVFGGAAPPSSAADVATGGTCRARRVGVARAQLDVRRRVVPYHPLCARAVRRPASGGGLAAPAARLVERFRLVVNRLDAALAQPRPRRRAVLLRPHPHERVAGTQPRQPRAERREVHGHDLCFPIACGGSGVGRMWCQVRGRA